MSPKLKETPELVSRLVSQSLDINRVAENIKMKNRSVLSPKPGDDLRIKVKPLDLPSTMTSRQSPMQKKSGSRYNSKDKHDSVDLRSANFNSYKDQETEDLTSSQGAAISGFGKLHNAQVISLIDQKSDSHKKLERPQTIISDN